MSLSVEPDPNGAFNISEFGTVKDPAQFKALNAYSPYRNAIKGTAHPAVLLMMTGASAAGATLRTLANSAPPRRLSPAASVRSCS